MSIATTLARKTAQLAEVDAMIAAYISANGVSEVSTGQFRTSRTPLDGLYARQRQLESDISHLNDRAKGPTYIFKRTL